MKILLYMNEQHRAGKRIRGLIETLVGRDKIETCSTIELLSARLSRFASDICVAVLLAVEKGDLLGFLSVGNLLDHVRVILILPDRGEKTVSLGHRLYPRYIGYLDSDFDDIRLVLQKILALHNDSTTAKDDFAMSQKKGIDMSGVQTS